MLATVSALPALSTTQRRGGTSGASCIMAFSATCSATSVLRCSLRGTSSVEPALARRDAVDVAQRGFAHADLARRSPGRMVFGATQAVQLASGARCSIGLYTLLNRAAEGEATAHVVSETLKARGLQVTRLSRGVPVGS